MSYKIKYDGSTKEKDMKAIKDVKSYIGKGKTWERLTIIIASLVGSGASMESITFACSFAGIQGYPVGALTRYVCDILGTDEPKYIGN